MASTRRGPEAVKTTLAVKRFHSSNSRKRECEKPQRRIWLELNILLQAKLEAGYSTLSYCGSAPRGR